MPGIAVFAVIAVIAVCIVIIPFILICHAERRNQEYLEALENELYLVHLLSIEKEICRQK